ncbi:MAG TPA: MOSC and FAD-binding oxidoreductase domain-containing protein [Stellaceae bacterium]|nr:MOSC and FAD-binding oxidoreductase domain-containing protein [Stellaceae bacterium]
MKVISVHVGLPRTVQWKGKAVSTGIFKAPVSGRIRLRTLNLDGDRQADLSVHGGPDKALYAYPAEHYAYWQRELPDMTLPWGIFGENLTTEGLFEDDLKIGDRFFIGSTEVAITQPRLPCYKLGLRFGRDDMVKRLLASGRTGFYFKVVAEGELAAGDPIIAAQRAQDSVSVSEITRLYARDKDDVDGLRRTVAVAALPDDWRDYFNEQINRMSARSRPRAVQRPAWAGFKPFTLREKVREGDDVSSFHLVPEDGQPLPSYLPGQYLTVRVAIPGLERPLVRSYSLSDASRNDYYRLTIKRIASRSEDRQAASGLVSTYFHDRLTVGDRIEAKAPSGSFTIDVTQHDRPLVLIGGGIGLTPLISMVNSIVVAGSLRETWLLYGVRNDRDYIMRTHLEAVATIHQNIHLHIFYSRPSREMDGPGVHSGHIDLGAMQHLIPSNAYDFYVCGPPSMMASVTGDLEAWGVPADRVHTEAFGPAAIKQSVRGPETQPDCGTEVIFARSGVTVLWSRCESPLLELAEENSVAIDFGCRAGSCGTCVTRLLSGTVRYLHEPNAPLESGEILPCIAVPAEPVSLDA